jgi:hypothetical protein
MLMVVDLKACFDLFSRVIIIKWYKLFYCITGILFRFLKKSQRKVVKWDMRLLTAYPMVLEV